MDNVITNSPYICAPNIMDSPDYVTKMVELDMTGTDCIKAGSPISADGKVANDETAIGILLTDCHTCLGAHRGLVVIDGRIKQDVAAAHSGITLSDKAKAALVNISFTGDGERMGGGGGLPTGGAPYQQLVTDGEGKAKWEDRLCYKGVTKTVKAEKNSAAFELYDTNKEAYRSENLPFYDDSLSYAIVTLDGVDYKIHGGDGALGNKSLFSVQAEDTGEPICLKMDVNIETFEFSCFVITNIPGDTHDVVISVPAETVVKIPSEYLPDASSVVLPSSTSGSTKKFRITVDDSGTISATEVTE